MTCSDEALALKFLGEAQRAIGQDVRARARWTAALADFEQIGEAAEAAEIEIQLAVHSNLGLANNPALLPHARYSLFASS